MVPRAGTLVKKMKVPVTGQNSRLLVERRIGREKNRGGVKKRPPNAGTCSRRECGKNRGCKGNPGRGLGWKGTPTKNTRAGG